MTFQTQQDNTLTETLRPGQAWSRVLRRGQHLRLTDIAGGACVAALFYNSEQFLERYNMPDTLKAQQIARLTKGFVLYSDMGKVLCSMVEDSCGWHDTISGHSTARSNLKKYGEGSYQRLRNDWYRNARDNFLVELGKYGLGKRDLGPNLNFFVKVAVDANGGMSFVERHSKAGDSVELRAEMDVLVVLSNTPHPLDPSPIYAPPEVALDITRGAPHASDMCRNSRPENARGFALTADYLGQTQAPEGSR